MDGFMLCPGRRPHAADWRASNPHNKYANDDLGQRWGGLLQGRG
jgi:hypothetical protein